MFLTMNLFLLKIPVSPAQLVFAAIFALVFSVLIYFTYKKDKAVHKQHYKKTGLWTFASFLLFIAVLYVIKFVLHK